MSIFLNLYVLVCACCGIIKRKEFFMYINITGSPNNKDVYIYQSYRKDNGKTSSRIYKKLGKFNDLLEQFHGDEQKLLIWAKEQAKIETKLYNQQKGTISVESLRLHVFRKRNFVLFLSVIFSFNRSARSSALIRSADPSKNVISLNMTCMLSLQILSMQGYSLLPANLAVMIFVKHYWSHQNTIYSMFTVLSL